MAHDPRKLLFDMIEACKKITAFTAGGSFEQFTSNDLVQSAVHMQCIIIGVALMRLRATDAGSTPASLRQTGRLPCAM